MSVSYWTRAVSGLRQLTNIVEVTDLTGLLRSSLAKATVTGDGNQPNTILTLTAERLDAEWSITANTMSHSGSPDYVQINAVAYYQQPLNTAFQRIAPVLELLKNGTVVAISASAYQRHANGHDSSSNTIAYTDHDPGDDPVYQLRAQQGGTQNDLLEIDQGHFGLVAYTKV